MDAVKFLKEIKRLCKLYEGCRSCPLEKLQCHRLLSCSNKDDDAIVSAVEKWSAEHPTKTRLMDFLEKFPNAMVHSDGIPLILPHVLGYCGAEDSEYCCSECRHRDRPFAHCWNLPLEK